MSKLTDEARRWLAKQSKRHTTEVVPHILIEQLVAEIESSPVKQLDKWMNEAGNDRDCKIERYGCGKWVIVLYQKESTVASYVASDLNTTICKALEEGESNETRNTH